MDKRILKYLFDIQTCIKSINDYVGERKVFDELLTICKQLKLPAADGKSYKTFPTNGLQTIFCQQRMQKL